MWEKEKMLASSTELETIFGLNAFLPHKIFVHADFDLFSAENKRYEVKDFSPIRLLNFNTPNQWHDFLE